MQQLSTSSDQKLKEKLKVEVEQVKEQLMTSMRELASTQQTNASLQQRITTLNKELAASRQAKLLRKVHAHV